MNDNETSTKPMNNFEIFEVRKHLQELIYVGPTQNNIRFSKPCDKQGKTENCNISQKTFRNKEGENAKMNIINDKNTQNYWKNYDAYEPRTVKMHHQQNVLRNSLGLEGFAVRNRCWQNTDRNGDLVVSSKNRSISQNVDNSFLTLHERGAAGKPNGSRAQNVHISLKKSKCTSIAKHYCAASTLHGLKYIGDPHLSLFERLFWIISFTAAVTTASLYIWSVYKKWISSPIIISLSPEPVSFEEFPFPSITLCNMNNAKKSEAERISRGSDKLEKLLLDDICNSENVSAFNDLDDESTKWSNVRRFMINVSQSCNDMLHYCQWHGIKFDCEKLFNPTMTDEGICCNFNSVHRNYLFFNPKDWTDLNVTYPFPLVDWTPENGYSPNTSPDSVPWRPYGAGKYFGLTLVLDADIDEYYCSSTASVGFKMLLHNPVETPKIADFAFSLSPGKETRIRIRPHISIASKTILKIPQKKRKCFFTSERHLRYYRTYTQRNCFLECEANFTQKICQCVQYYMPKSANTSICGKKDDQCAIRARRAMELKLYDDEDTNNQLNITETPSCNCWPGCYEVGYSPEMSHSTLSSTFDVDDIYVKKDQRYFVKNIAVVHLFFVDSQFTKFVKNELFGFTEFLSNIGGLLGLFMGFSVLSFMEIIYFATLRFWCKLRRNQNTQIPTDFLIQSEKNNQHIIYPFAQ